MIDSVNAFDQIEEPLFNVYPNPAENVLNIDYSLSDVAEVQFEVADILGRSLASYNFNYTQPNQLKTEQLSLTNIPKGMYVVYLKANNSKVSSKKIIVYK